MRDEELGEALHALFAAADAVPPAQLAAASAALGWRDIDAQLAALTADSLDADSAGPAAAVRGAPTRLLSFATDTLTIDLEITGRTGAVDILGQVAPTVSGPVVVEYPGGYRATAVDELGRFGVGGLPAGWLRVRVDGGPDRARSHTEWFRA